MLHFGSTGRRKHGCTGFEKASSARGDLVGEDGSRQGCR